MLFAIFDQKWAKFSPNFLQIWCFKLIWSSVSTHVFLFPLLLAFKCIPHAKYKKPPVKCQFLCFLTTLDLIWPKFCPKDHTHGSFFVVHFHWNMLGDSININNLCCNPVALKKKLVKPLKNCFFRPNLHKKVVIMGHTQNEKKKFFSRNNKTRSSAFRNFILSKYHMFWPSYQSFSILSYVFCQKSIISS